jgi:hypothetical protein
MSEGDFPFSFGDFVQDLFPDVVKGPSNRINDKEDAKIDYYLVIFLRNACQMSDYYCKRFCNALTIFCVIPDQISNFLF